MRRYRDFDAAQDAAQDAVQEALLAAAMHWPAEGLPDNPRGWLIQTAGAAADRPVPQRPGAAAPGGVGRPAGGARCRAGAADDALVLLFMCCHPALTPASSIALTLRVVAGLSTAEIAKACLVPEATMAQRISRAKQKIKASGIPFRMPAPEEFAPRLGSVLHLLYLLFNEGYASSTGAELHPTDLTGEAIRLTRAVHAMLPEHGEVIGLLALMLLNDARRPARTGAHGELIPLAEQDRARWDRAAIVEGVRLTATAMSGGAVGEYQLQAAIAALHDGAGRAEDTDWPQILDLYGLLERITGNPMMTLNRANRNRHGARTANRAGRVGTAGRATVRALPARRRARPSARHARQHRGRGRALPRRRSADHEHPERQYLITKAARLNKQNR